MIEQVIALAAEGVAGELSAGKGQIADAGVLDPGDERIKRGADDSEDVAGAMAVGALHRFGVGAGLAVTGIAGPSGGSSEKPVGTVWVAAAFGRQTRALKRIFPGDRSEIRARAAQAALDLMRRLIVETHS